MLKSIFTVLGSAVSLVLKYILVIGLTFTAGFCLITVFMEPFIWSGALRTAGLILSVLIVLWIIRRRKED